MSQQEVADLLGIPKGTMGSWVVKTKNGMSQIAPGTPWVRDVMAENHRFLRRPSNLGQYTEEISPFAPGNRLGTQYRNEMSFSTTGFADTTSISPMKKKFNNLEKEGVTRWVEYAELKENDFNLNIARYPQKPLEEEKNTVEEALRDFKAKLAELELLLEREGFEL